MAKATIVNYFLGKLKPNSDVFFVQIGANDGVYADPLHDMVKKNGWSGILVEPLPDIFERLRANYAGVPNLIFENVAISRLDRLTLYRIVGDFERLPGWMHCIASFDAETVLSHRYIVPDIDRYMVKEEVPGINFSKLMERNAVERFDVLVVDTEGYDAEVLRMVDFKKFLPTLVLFERAHLNRADYAETLQRLDSEGYFSIPIGGDVLSIRRDMAHAEDVVTDYQILGALQAELERVQPIVKPLAGGGIFRSETDRQGRLRLERIG